MAVSTQRRQAPKPEPEQEEDIIPNSIFEALQDHPLGQQYTQQQKKTQVEEPEKGPDVTALLAQIAEMKSQLDSMSASQTALLSTPPQVDPILPKVPTEQELFAGLPNPLDDQEGYARELAARLSKRQELQNQYDHQQNQQNQTRAQHLESLWEDFAQDYGDYADEPRDQLEFVIKKVADRARGRGINLDRYMFTARERFMGDVVKEYDRVFGAPEAEVEAQPQQKQKRPRNARAVTQELGNDPDRSGGIFGETGVSTRSNQQEEPRKGDMISDLRELQKNSGFW
jgi:hypothetical protein